MKTPAFRPFIQAVGKTVHHLNTIAVGLSGVEAGACSKPTGLDISWCPADLSASSRDARSFTLKSTIVFVAEELCAYNSKIIGSPNIGEVALPKKPDRGLKHEALCKHINMQEKHLILGPLLLIHWRNRLIHKSSKATLTRNQITDFKSTDNVLMQEYKSLSADRLLIDFEKNLPTLKDVSSLIAMTINYVHSVEEKIPEPTSKDDFESWLKHIDLYGDFERITRVAANKPKPEQTILNFINTNCPELRDTYFNYCKA